MYSCNRVTQRKHVMWVIGEHVYMHCSDLVIVSLHIEYMQQNRFLSYPQPYMEAWFTDLVIVYLIEDTAAS